MKLLLCLGGVGLTVFGYVRLHAVGGWYLVLTTLAVFVAAFVIGAAAKALP